MSDPKEQQREPDEADELELEGETVKDLDVEEQSADEVRGGRLYSGSLSGYSGS